MPESGSRSKHYAKTDFDMHTCRFPRRRWVTFHEKVEESTEMYKASVASYVASRGSLPGDDKSDADIVEGGTLGRIGKLAKESESRRRPSGDATDGAPNQNTDCHSNLVHDRNTQRVA